MKICIGRGQTEPENGIAHIGNDVQRQTWKDYVLMLFITLGFSVLTFGMK